MATGNNDSPRHTEKELWLQILATFKELQDCKAELRLNGLDSISDKIEGLEKELDFLLKLLHKSDK